MTPDAQDPSAAQGRPQGRAPHQLVLAIDTAGPVIGAALAGPDGPVASWSLRVVRGADAALLPAVAQLLEDLDPDGPALAAVAVTVGPGTFTGLRVGVATALGVAVARGLPVVPLSSLLVRAALVDDEPSVLALLDARKGRVYAGHFVVQGGQPRPLSAEQDAPLDAVLPAGDFVAVGEGAAVMAERIIAAGGRVVDAPARSPAVAAALLARSRPALDAGEVALRYLRPPDAVPPADLGERIGPAR